MTNTRTTGTGTYFGALMAMTALLAAIIIAMSALSVPAIGKQSDNLNKGTSGSKMDAAVATSSTTTTPKASFASGSFGVKVSDHGNLMSFATGGLETVFGGREGYAVCTQSAEGSGVNTTVHGHDTGDVQGGFGVPTFSQPNGSGTFPLTVTRTTTDGKFRLKQVWNKPDPVERDVTVSMTLTNLSSALVTNVLLSRSGDFDVGSSADQGAATVDSAWQWNDRARSASEAPRGIMLSNLSSGIQRGSTIEPQSDWINFTRTTCINNPLGATSTSVQDLAMRVEYDLGNFNGGQSKTVKFEYRSM